MIRRIVEYVAAHRALAKASLSDLADDRYSEEDESPEYADAHERVCLIEDEMTSRQNLVADPIAMLINRRLWKQVWDIEDDLEQRGIWTGIEP